MAFFLLMWLLGSHTAKEGELQGIAAYFASPLKVAMAVAMGRAAAPALIPWRR